MVDFTGVAKHYRQKANNVLHKTDPVLWAKDTLDVYFWSKQQEILRALVTHKNVAVKTTFSVGKTMSAAMAMGWWIDTRGSDALVVSTAPTFRQVNSLLWEELRKAHVRSGLKGRILQEPRWMMEQGIDGRSMDVIVGMGIKPADTGGDSTTMHSLQGLHRKGGILAVIDEACGVSEGIFAGVQRITTGDHDRVLALGNPTDGDTKFGKLWRDKPEDWYLMTISAFDTPRFTGEYAPADLIQGMPAPDWVELRRKEWGEDSNRWVSEILAEFPDTSDDGLFNMALVKEAIATEVTKDESAAPIMGVDIARYGTDKNVAFVRYGNQVEFLESWTGLDTVQSAERIANLARGIGCLNIRVDAIGVGAGVVDNLARLMPDAAVYEMIGNAAAPDNTKHYNARAYWYDSLRKEIASGDLKIPDHDRLYDEFGVIRYEIRGSAMLIESKEDMRKRGIKSPDYLDALVYTCADVSGALSGEDTIEYAEEAYYDEFDDDLYSPSGLEEWQFAPA